MKMLRKGIAFIAAICCPLCLLSQTTTTDSTIYLSIDDMFDLAKANSLQMKIRNQQVDQTDEDLAQQRSQRLPEISLNASGGYIGQPIMFNQGLTDPTYPETPNWSQNYDLQISQPLYQGGRINLRIKRAEIENEISRTVAESDWSELKLQLLQEYLNLYNSYRQEQVLKRDIEEAVLRQRNIHNMYEEGLVTSNDEIRGNLQLTQRQLDLRVTEDAIRIASLRLKVLLGLGGNCLIVPDSTITALAERKLQSVSDYMDMALSSYPGMRIEKLQCQMSELDVRLSKSEYLPALSLFANYGLDRPITSTMEDKFLHNWNIGLNVSFPLSSLYRNNHAVKRERISSNIRQTEMEQLVQELTVRVNQSYIEHRQAQDRVNTLTIAVMEAQENYRVVRNRYMSQLSILTDLLDAETVLLDSELQLSQAKTDVIYSYYRLMQVCGKF